MGVLAFRVDNLSNWEKENPLLEDGEMAIVRDAKQYRIGDGFHKFKDLEPFGHGMTAYEIAVLHGHFRGSIEDFASQFNQFSRYGEQQCGKFTNDGPGWNAFHFPEEFGEDVYITAIVENKDAFVAIKNVTKTGFHYCVYTSDGKTTAENVVINYNAVAVSSKNLAHSIAQIAGLNPFDFDNLEMLFMSNVTEVVENEQAFGIVKRSSMAAAKYICLLTDLDIYNYHNVASAAADSTAMNIIAASPAAREFVQSSPAAYDALRLSEMATAKYSISLAGLAPDNFSVMADIFANQNALDALVKSAVAMAAVAGSAVAMAAVAGSAVAMAAVAGSAVAMAAIRAHQAALDRVLNSSIAMTEVSKVNAAVVSFFDDANALSCLVSSATAMAAVADSATAMAAVADSATAMAAVADSATAMAAIRSHQPALDRVLNSSLAMTKIANVSSAVSSFFNDANALHCLVSNATAMAAIMGNQAAQEVFWNVKYSFGRGLATYANINNSTLIGLQSLSAVAASATASKAVDSVINTYSNTLYATLNSSSVFTKTTQEYAHSNASNGSHYTGQTATGNTITFVTYIKDAGSGANTFIVTSMANNNQLINQQITQTTVNFNPKKVALRGVAYDFGTYYPSENRLGLEIFTVK